MNKTLTIAMLLILGISGASLADLASMRNRIPELVSAKEKGWICEQNDGLVKAINAQAAGLVKAENQDRLSTYKTRAAKQSHSLTTFMKVMGAERTKQEKSGRFVENNQGKCVQKP